MELSEQVQQIMMDSLYKSEEIVEYIPPNDAVIVKGIVRTFGFHPERLKNHKEEVKTILNQMRPEFHKDKGGGGWSFLNLCEDKDGHLWGDHRIMEELVALGIGLGIAKYCFPKDMWNALPGGAATS